MSSLREKERAKEQQDKLQAILSSLLKDEDNKYCVDCDAKGPRWASWNLGVFLCIRCAGIHRNLGVHISKVKSVNLDSWTPEQVAMMQEIGNSRGRAVYEANIPDGFRRPQSDSALEAYVRSKYEQKKYIAREWVPPHPKAPKEWYEDSKAEKKKARSKPTSSIQLTNVPKPVNKPAAAVSPVSQVKPAAVPEAKAPEPPTSSASNDLLGLDLGPAQSVAQQPPVPAPASAGNNELLDIFGGSQSANHAPNPAAPQPSGSNDLMNGASETNLFGEETSSGSEKKGSTKDSIMALFGGSGAPQPQMYGVPGAGGQNYYYQLYDGHNMAASASQQVNAEASDDLMQMHGPVNGGLIGGGGQQQQQSSLMSAPVSNAPAKSLGNQLVPVSQAARKEQQLQAHIQGQVQALGGQATTVSLAQGWYSGQPGQGVMALQPGQGTAWQYYSQVSPGFYGNQGGMYVPQGQQMYPGMMGQPQGMMGQPQGMMGTPPQGLMGTQSQGMMGQPQGMMATQSQGMMGNQSQGMMGNQSQGMMGNQSQGMMGNQSQGMMGNQSQGMMGNQSQGIMGNQSQGMIGQPQGMIGQQPQGMMGNPQMNGAQATMFGQPQMMGANQAMYTPQQMQQLQFQQMQQQMTSMKLSGAQMGNMPQQATSGMGSWGNQGPGQTLSTNLWQ